MNEAFHILLQRQMKRLNIDLSQDKIPESYLKLFSHISNAYVEAEQGRYTTERSMEISSQEMYELRQKLQKEREIIQAVMSEGLCVIDPFWKITNLNLTGGKLLCCSTSLVQGKIFTEIFTLYENDNLEKKEVEIDTLRKIFTGKTNFAKENIYNCERGFLKTFHGVLHPVSFSINPLPLINNKLFGGAVIVFRDITERLENEIFLKNSLKIAEQSSKAKTLFLANMSHEIRTPMNGILGMLQLLLHSTLDEKQQHYIEKSIECANSLLKIIGDILDFSKIEAGKIDFENVEFDLKKEFETMKLIFTSGVKEKHIKLDLNFDKDVPSLVKGDPLRLKQIVNNLVKNAIKFTPENGEIFINVELQVLQEEDFTILVSITDTGIGISKDSQSKIFEIFSQADESTTRKYGGTGLGLAIAKQLVEQMGGHISVQSQEDKGSTFSFTLKYNIVKNKESSVNLPQSLITESNSQFNADILVVEDNELNQLVVHDMLKALGCHPDIVDSGKKAIEAIQERKYDLIFMDCQMPEMDGFITTQKIRQIEFTEDHKGKAAENRIIIALTANALKGTKEHCLEVGMNDYMTKPLTLAQLHEMLKKYLPAKITRTGV